MKPLVMIMLLARASLAADDPGGWSKARWGMTDAQLSDAFGADAIHLDAPDENGVRTVVLLDLAEVPCFAEMVPDRAGRLASVMVLPRKISNMTNSLYLTLQELLVQKYGRPWKTSEQSGNTVLQWAFPTTAITLIRAKVSTVSTRVFAIQYKRITSDSDKL